MTHSIEEIAGRFKPPTRLTIQEQENCGKVRMLLREVALLINDVVPVGEDKEEALKAVDVACWRALRGIGARPGL